MVCAPLKYSARFPQQTETEPKRSPKRTETEPKRTKIKLSIWGGSRGKQQGGFVEGRFGRMCLRSGSLGAGEDARMYQGQKSAQGISHWEIKGRFRRRVVLANVPSFRFSFRENMRRNHPFGNHPFVNTKKGHWEIKGRFPKGWFWRTYLRSGFWYRGTSAETTLLETTLLRTPEFCASGTRIWGRILGNEFWTPEFWTRILGSNFLILFFLAEEAF